MAGMGGEFLDDDILQRCTCKFIHKSPNCSMTSLFCCRVTQHDGLPKWICKQCLEKIDDFTSFRERCKQNERKLLLGEDDCPAVLADGHIDPQTDEDDDEEMEMIVIDPSQDYESSNDSLPNEANGAKNAIDSYLSSMGTFGIQPEHAAEEEDGEGSEAEEGEEEEEEDDEGETKCDTLSSEIRNGLPSHSDSTPTTAKVQKTVVHTCKYCDVAFGSSAACQLHELQEHDLLAPYGCIYCHYKTSIRTYLITHIRDSHSLTRPYICVQCNKGFLRRSDLKKHTFVHTGIRPFACDQCSKSFSRNTNLKKHMRTHLGLKPHVCHLCPRSFANKADLVRHRSYHSEQEAQYSCLRCGTLYTQKDKLYEHERYCMGKSSLFGSTMASLTDVAKQDIPLVGESNAQIPPIPQRTEALELNRMEPTINDPPGFDAGVSVSSLNVPQTPPSSKIYNCSKCPKRFLSKASLRVHQGTHPVEDKGNYACPQCSKPFVVKREYDLHLQTHPELKPYECTTCGKRFSRKDKLHRHERIHQPERNFSCPDCSAKFTRKDAFESHLRIHCTPNVEGHFTSMGSAPGTEMVAPMSMQQHSLLYSMVRDDGTIAVDPSIRM
uniref:C2H2-type domain-containing protein n=1 Tax=Anopheles culicifacies TaxID=139723 RepID=A0A182M9C7_9DIPT